MEIIHEADDRRKVREIAKSIEESGFIGAPLVVDGNQLITGMHRYAACQMIGMADYEIPTIEITEVFEEAGLDYFEIHVEEGAPTIDEHAYIYVLDALPEAVKDKYGIDLH